MMSTSQNSGDGKKERIVDLTLPVSERTPSFPGSPKTQFLAWSKRKMHGFNLELLFTSTHVGTHVDAPFHFCDSGKKIHEVDPKQFVCKCYLVKTKKGKNQTITKSEIKKFEAKNNIATLRGCGIVFSTGWSSNLRNTKYFEENPGLSADAARYLGSKGPRIVGIDSPSIDAGNNSDFTGHKVFCKKGIVILENLYNLGKIKSASFRLAAQPLLLEGATGSPVRALAIV